jgi:hypothetical protein
MDFIDVVSFSVTITRRLGRGELALDCSYFSWGKLDLKFPLTYDTIFAVHVMQVLVSPE